VLTEVRHGVGLITLNRTKALNALSLDMIRALTDALLRWQPGTQVLRVCGGGAHNRTLMSAIGNLLPSCHIDTTAALGLPPDWVEAAAFAWLARRTLQREPGNIPEVTGAAGARILGAVYPA